MLPGFQGMVRARIVVPGVITLNTPGAANFVVPEFNTLVIEGWGPGGTGQNGAAYWNGYTYIPVPGAGAAGGGYFKKTYTAQQFSPGSTLACVIGASGANTTIVAAGLTATTGSLGGAYGTGYGGDVNTSGSAASGSTGGAGASPGGGAGGAAYSGWGSNPGGGGAGGFTVGNPGGAGGNGQLKFTWS
jgi:hypothetical protein